MALKCDDLIITNKKAFKSIKSLLKQF